MRAFFFTLASFIVLLYVSLIASLQTSALLEIGKAYNEMGDVYSFSALVGSFSEESVKRMVASLAYYALNKMAEHSVQYPLYASGEDGAGYAQDALLSLMREGKSDRFTRPLHYNETERATATLKGIREHYNEVLASTPYHVEELDVEIENMSFADAFHLNLSVVLKVNVSGPRGGVAYKKETSVLVPLKGLPDPMVNRFSKGFREVWPFNHTSYRLGEVPQPIPLPLTAEAGQGWFYGPVVMAGEELPEEKRWLYALAGTLEEIQETDGWRDFGAYVVLGGIKHDDSDGDGCVEEGNTFNPFDPDYDPTTGECVDDMGSPATDKPYVVLGSNRLPPLPREGYFGREVIFFKAGAPVGRDSYDEKYGEVVLLNIEDVRDGVNCQAYFSSGESGISAPNYFQRMLERPWDHTDGENGIFSFLVGKEFEDGYPALDFLYAKALSEGCPETYYVLGLAGTKMPEMVDGSTMVNKFALPKEVVLDLRWRDLLGDVACLGSEESGEGGGEEESPGGVESAE